MSSESSERALELITRSNPRTLRSAAVASHESPVAVLQFLRLVRESKNANRRLFYHPAEASKWLGEVLTPEEADRLAQFLSE